MTWLPGRGTDPRATAARGQTPRLSRPRLPGPWSWTWLMSIPASRWPIAVRPRCRPAGCSCGRDSGMRLVGVEEPAVHPGLVQVAAGHLDPPRVLHPAGPDRVEPRDGDEPLDSRGSAVVVGGVEEHRPARSPVRAAGE